jgi:hypothetical protein
MRKLAVGVLLALVFGGAVARAAEEFGRLSVQEVAKKRLEKNVYVIDNNDQNRWRKSHVPGAKWVNPYEMKASDLPIDKTATLVFYCANTH